ncbi:uncharacterized protein LOC110883503 [Helianthus annuus]|uniref:uncharacterized protein LOC110883503 n=1 Tax=Helianthus annuus TaxID=4232 RepID=UPI000B90281E|nr:uncharacterized protein LOC110883503 [Helianthus annuus]
MSSRSSSDSSSFQSDGMIDDMFIVVKQEAIQYLREEVESPTTRNRQVLLERDRLGAHERLMQDYFSKKSLYDDAQFRRRFRMSCRLFLKISNDLASQYLFFTQRESASRKIGFSGIQKCTAAIRQLAYDTTSDACDEYLRMLARSCRDCLNNFYEGVNFLYKRRYLRMPTAIDAPLLYEAHQRIHGFP